MAWGVQRALLEVWNRHGTQPKKNQNPHFSPTVHLTEACPRLLWVDRSRVVCPIISQRIHMNQVAEAGRSHTGHGMQITKRFCPVKQASFRPLFLPLSTLLPFLLPPLPDLLSQTRIASNSLFLSPPLRTFLVGL